MSFRFNKKVKLGKNLGVNISKSGITPTYKTGKYQYKRVFYSYRNSWIIISQKLL